MNNLFLRNNEQIYNHEILINAYINDKAKLSRKEFLERLSHVQYIRTKRISYYLKFYISTFEEFNNLEKFHDLVNKGIFDFRDEFTFSVAIQPKLYNWFKNTDLQTIQKQIVSWLTGLYFFGPEKRSIMEEQIYSPLLEEIIKNINTYYKDYPNPNFQELIDKILEDDNKKEAHLLEEEYEQKFKNAEQKYLDVCKNIYNGKPPEFLISPFEYEYIEGWSLSKKNFGFEIILSYFNELDWEKVFVRKESEDDLRRVESRSDLWQKWKHIFGTFDKRKNFIYNFYYSEIRNDKKNKDNKREKIPQDVKDAVWKRDEGKCVECQRNEKLEFDHIIPVIKGGSSTYRNIQLLCETCNRKKHSKLGVK